jgi:hydrogenase nickel incorporation protein HypA/HybF
MHEYSIVESLLQRVDAEARKHGPCTVSRIQVSIGELAGVEPDLLESAYTVFRERTICENATLEIQRVEARWSCPTCDRTIAAGETLHCPECGMPACLNQGDEIVLDRIELEVT